MTGRVAALLICGLSSISQEVALPVRRALLTVAENLRSPSGMSVERGEMGEAVDSLLRQALDSGDRPTGASAKSALRIRLVSVHQRGGDTVVVRVGREKCDRETGQWFRDELEYKVLVASSDAQSRIHSRWLRNVQDGTCRS